jgi:hypothetical protein
MRVEIRILYIAGYAVLILFSVLWTEINHLPLWMIAITSIPLIIADIFSDYNPKILAFAYTQRKQLAFIVLLSCTLIGALCYALYPFHKIYGDMTVSDQFILITQFLLQGAIAGLTLRMLLLNLFADMLRARGIHKAKLLIMVAWVVFLIMFPVNERHRSLSAIFIVGFGIGFLTHYMVRTQEKQNAKKSRLRENILSMIATLKSENGTIRPDNSQGNFQLSQDEERAVTLYSNQKWKKLKHFISDKKETDTLFFIRLSMLRKLHDYENALHLLNEKMTDQGAADQHFYHLHYALNESERFDHKGDWVNREKIFSNLEKANTINPDCLLTCATYALRIASELNTDISNQNDKRNTALRLIWHAMKLYEQKSQAKVVSLVTGMTIPVTYTFLLDTYGYVLLKCGKTRFAKALILQGLFQDPSYSATYLHLAEWYLNFYGEDNSQEKKFNDLWRKAARLNLYIAIEIEREYDSQDKGTFISMKAKKLLKKI